MSGGMNMSRYDDDDFYDDRIDEVIIPYFKIKV